MYTKAAQHTVKLPLVDSLGVALSTAPTITISKDGGAFAAVTNTPTAVGSTWNLVLTTVEADCDGYTLHITHTDLAMPVFYQDEASADVALTSTAQTALVAAIEAEIADDATGEAVKQAIIDKLLTNLPDIDDLSLAAIAEAVAAAILVDPANKIDVDETGITKAGDGNGNVVATNSSMANGFDAVPAAVAAAVWALANAIDGKTPAEAMRYIAAVLAGKATGAGSAAETFVGLDGSTPRVRVTADAEGNRTAVEYDPEATP